MLKCTKRFPEARLQYFFCPYITIAAIWFWKGAGARLAGKHLSWCHPVPRRVAMCPHCVGTETAEMCRKELRFYCGGVSQCSCYSNLTNQGHLVRENKCRKMKTYKNTKIVLSHQSYQSHLAAYLCQVIIPNSTHMFTESSFLMTIINVNITSPL